MVLPALLAACDDDDDEVRRFTVTVDAVSAPQTIDSTRAMGTVPLSAGAFVVFRGDIDPAFRVGTFANTGTELLAEEGIPSAALAPVDLGIQTQLEIFEDAQNALAFGPDEPVILEFGEFTASGGADNGPAIFPALDGFPAEVSTFMFDAEPGDRLQLQTMFLQSNDWFYAFDDGGLDLFPVDANGISGDVTDQLVLFDAGTEVDTPPGTGPDQKLAQAAGAINVGVAEMELIAFAADRHPSFVIPPTSAVIRVTISSVPVLGDEGDLDD